MEHSSDREASTTPEAWLHHRQRPAYCPSGENWDSPQFPSHAVAIRIIAIASFQNAEPIFNSTLALKIVKENPGDFGAIALEFVKNKAAD